MVSPNLSCSFLRKREIFRRFRSFFPSAECWIVLGKLLERVLNRPLLDVATCRFAKKFSNIRVGVCAVGSDGDIRAVFNNPANERLSIFPRDGGQIFRYIFPRLDGFLNRLQFCLCVGGFLRCRLVLRPLPELSDRHLGDRPELVPPGFVVVQICLARLLLGPRAKNDLVLVEAAFIVLLVNNEDVRSRLRSGSQENVDMVLVLADCLKKVPVVVGHFGFPRCPIRRRTRTSRAPAVLKSNLYAEICGVRGNVSLLIITRLFLRVCRLMVDVF